MYISQFLYTLWLDWEWDLLHWGPAIGPSGWATDKP